MRVGLIAYLLHGGTGYRAAGVSTYSSGLISALAAECPSHDYLVFHGRDALPQLRCTANVAEVLSPHAAFPRSDIVPPAPGRPSQTVVRAHLRSVLTPLPIHQPPVRVAWEQFGLPIQAHRHRLDLLHGLVNVLPVASGIPAVVTVHDLAFLRHPERFHRLKAEYLRWAVRLSVARSRHVIAVSGNTRDDCIDLLRLPADRVSVVYPGLHPRFRPLPIDDVLAFRQRVTDGRPYLLYVGTLEPRKNIDILIRAYELARQTRRIPHQLVLVGAPGWMYDSLFQLVSELGLRDHVRFAGYASPEDLPLWYNAADLFAYPSEYEGFGLPVLEAMACGTPTVTSDSSSLKELAGSACLTVQAGSQEALLVALTQLLDDAHLRRHLRVAGLARAAQFSWARAARETVAVYEEACGA